MRRDRSPDVAVPCVDGVRYLNAGWAPRQGICPIQRRQGTAICAFRDHLERADISVVSTTTSLKPVIGLPPGVAKSDQYSSVGGAGVAE